ncbi:pre-mRNA-splicing factor sap114 [Gaeumannomyces tritici R3-111a-1]|uniref:Pre-mRNA-splicing factor sap114 n=1 Tax=Gaeumannomyces tritici (strain R3-111a-1) TaxID=644352 RepID=J3NUL0_GAET3|nr:pre-mRNA-splicing factor sap114 [Gaeumannomyces tritici R3-111a-1]EJT79883.1 pre-mRNA-splicing factor sap114 [Gaeumannomyces tritici R3-111a-1]
MAANGEAAAVAAAQLDSIKPPEGVIIPPPGEIREVIEKTAGYVVRGGVGIEQRLRENHGNNSKFGFVVNSDDPYHPYYEWRKAEYKAGRGTAVAAGRASEAVKQAEAVEVEDKGPPKPPDFEFSAKMPRMNQKDVEVLRLTALFIARNGRQFQTQLAQREAKNPQFQFLIPNHTFHNFFQHTVDQYATILKEDGMGGDGSRAQEVRVAALRRNAEDRFSVLERARQRTAYSAWQAQQRQKEEALEEKKKDDFARIDWNDFVVVETITFSEADESIALPPPTTLNDIQYASLEEKKNFSLSALRIEEAFPFEDTDYNAHPVRPQPAQPQPQQNALDLPVHPGPSPQQQRGYAGPVQDEEEVRRIQEREQARARAHEAQAQARPSAAPVKIKENYVPKAAARGVKAAGQMAICPRCNEQVLMSELEEHMRIELLDPRWKEQKAKAESRYATTNMATADAANNLKRLASQRTDVFDSVTGQPLSEEEMARRKKATINSYDGNPDGKSQAHIAHLQNVNVEEQIRAIQQKFGERKD